MPPRASKRRNLTSRDNDDGNEPPLTAATARFADVMEGSVNTTVDPRSCIPLTKVRSYSKSGIQRLKRLFRGCVSEGSCAEYSPGVVAGSDAPVLIALEGTYKQHILEYFMKEKELEEGEARLRVQSKITWFGVVDGMHRLLAILELIDEEPERWDGFSWPVTILKGGHDILQLRQLARHQNEKHSQSHYIETTLYDHLKGLKEEADRMAREANGKRPSAREVASAYDGSTEFKCQTVMQLANTTMRLSNKVISVLGEIMNSEHPELVSIPPELEERLQGAEKDVIMGTVDCRVYRKFVNVTSLKSATVFMKGNEEYGEDCQINALYRCRDICREQNFKAVSHRIVSEQYKKAVLAIRECRKLEHVMETEKWPEEMETLKRNLLRTPKFDREIGHNENNDMEVLPILLDCYKRACPGISPMKIRKFRESTASGNESNPVPGSGMEAENGADAQVVEQFGNAESEAVQNRAEGEVPNFGTNEDAEVPAVGSNEPVVPDEVEQQEVAVLGERQQGKEATVASQKLDRNTAEIVTESDVLAGSRITAHNMKWQEFDRTLQTDECEKYDLILTDPPYGVPSNPAKAGTKYVDFVDDKERAELAQFCRRSLVPGGYVVLFTSVRYFWNWVQAFRDSGFRTMEYPIVLHKDTNRMQGLKVEEFPQNNCEFAMVAHAPGKSKTGFKPDFVSPYNLLPCKQKRRYASIINCPIPTKKLTNGVTKAPILTEEKNVNVLCEIIATFAPDGGSVLDCYGGTLTTAIASMKMKKKCCVIESSAEVFQFARKRLCMMAENENEQALKPVRLMAGRSNVGNSRITRSVTNERSCEGENVKGSTNEQSIGSQEPCPETRDETQGDEEHLFKGGEKVWLCVEGEGVATAKLQAGNDSSLGLNRSIHGYNLRQFEKEGECLVAVYNVEVEDEGMERMYPYFFKSLDNIPVTVGEMRQDCMYAWDLNCVQKFVR